ncbi:hypothetical protein BMAA0813 [Burkholderia mallei ATCC 23344]|uniref:Uncharacterized protein n=1 Tax=Burkholderia mallei (strain ATCC 23344) TaxID=243160 RepID=A0A0H2WEK7_BURMA|nr:hypothetical protein BMAA0813 [Burkholderia mallei ATCC 23344]
MRRRRRRRPRRARALGPAGGAHRMRRRPAAVCIARPNPRPAIRIGRAPPRLLRDEDPGRRASALRARIGHERRRARELRRRIRLHRDPLTCPLQTGPAGV